MAEGSAQDVLGHFVLFPAFNTERCFHYNTGHKAPAKGGGTWMRKEGS
jgi:hypothetical protein